MSDYSEIEKLKAGYMKANNELRQHCDEMESLANDKSVAERDYREAMAKAVVNLKAEGQPATLIIALAKGRVAGVQMQRTLKDALYNVSRENIKRCHANIDSYRTLLSLAKATMELK